MLKVKWLGLGVRVDDLRAHCSIMTVKLLSFLDVVRMREIDLSTWDQYGHCQLASGSDLTECGQAQRNRVMEGTEKRWTHRE